MRILITGISGYIGSNAAAYFENAGYDVRGIALSAGKKTRKADITDATAVRAAMRAIKPDMVLHAAGMSSLKSCEENEKAAHAVNVIGTKNIVDALAASNPDATFILLSTDYVFDCRRGNFTEGDSPRPATVYGKSKFLAEKEAARLKNHVIIRTSAVFGRGGNFFTYLTESFARGEAVEAYSDAYFSPTNIDFLLDSIGKLIGQKFRGAIHVAGCERISRHDFARMVALAMGKPASFAKPSRRPSSSLIATDSSLNTALSRKMTGLRCPSAQKAVDCALGSLIYPYFSHTDARGSITGASQGKKWEEINFITSNKGSLRGGHYHRKTVEGILVVQGRIKISMLDMQKRKHWGFVAEKGDFFIIPAGVSHTFEMLEDSSWVNMLDKAMKGAQKDIWKA